MTHTFTDRITTEEELRAIMGHPAEMNINKEIAVLDKHCKAFIGHSSFMLIASSDGEGNVDISPKGDPPGFVQILDDMTLAIPDRIGNRRADTLTNILKHDHVALLFMIPGKRETLRVYGRAMIVQDMWLRERMAVKSKIPNLAIVVNVEKAFMHCAKCVIRSKLWDEENWPDASDLIPMQRILIDHANLSVSVEEMDKLAEDSYKNRLY